VRLGCGCRCEKRRVSLGQCSFTLAHGSLRSNNIGDAGAWDVGAALQVNSGTRRRHSVGVSLVWSVGACGRVSGVVCGCEWVRLWPVGACECVCRLWHAGTGSDNESAVLLPTPFAHTSSNGPGSGASIHYGQIDRHRYKIDRKEQESFEMTRQQGTVDRDTGRHTVHDTGRHKKSTGKGLGEHTTNNTEESNTGERLRRRS
jgi:hypothetical protein